VSRVSAKLDTLRENCANWASCKHVYEFPEAVKIPVFSKTIRESAAIIKCWMVSWCSGGRPQCWWDSNTSISIMKYGGPCAPSQQRWLTMLDVQMSCGAAKSCRNAQVRLIIVLSSQED
jgi:hypothetical protein